MSVQIEALLNGAHPASAPEASATGAPGSAAERLRLQRLASEFEAMLLTQMLRAMREAGRWEDENQEEEDTFGGMPLLEMLDAELASHLSKVQGLGVAREMLAAFDRSSRVNDAASHRVATPASVTPALAPVTSPLPSVASAPAEAQGRDVTSAFGWRRDPLTGETRFHRGVDLRAAYGEEVLARAPGRVIASGRHGTYGTTVVVEHTDGSRTRFAHLSAALVRVGDRVDPGQLVGRVGSSGRATGPHLHLERTDSRGRPIDPLADTHQ